MVILQGLFWGFANVTLLIMMGITLIDVVLRFVFARPLLGATEVVELMMVCQALTLPHALYVGRVVRMELLINRFGWRTSTIMKSAWDLSALLLLVPLAFRLAKEVEFAKAMRYASSILMIPYAPFYALLAVSIGVSAVLLVFRSWKQIRGLN